MSSAQTSSPQASSVPAITSAAVAAECGALPHPGAGATLERWNRLVDVARRDLALAKLVEPHHDAAAILAEIEDRELPMGIGATGKGEIWAVWAAEPPFAVVTATRAGGGWRLDGRKAFCSGADLVTHALVTAATDDGPRLFAVQVDSAGISIDTSAPQWAGPGMARARTDTLVLDAVAAEPIGGPGEYTDRTGFWLGAIGIAACWFGGTLGVADVLEAGSQRLGPHGQAHLGAVRAGTETFALALEAAAGQVDAGLDLPAAQRLAMVLRASAASLAEDVMSRTGRATGPGPLAFDEPHARRVADLQVFIRQHHAERDLETLGGLS